MQSDYDPRAALIQSGIAELSDDDAAYLFDSGQIDGVCPAPALA